MNDVLKIFGSGVWTLMKDIQPAICMYLVRWDIILLLCILYGFIVMQICQRWQIYRSLPLQITAVTAAILFGISLNLELIKNLSPETRNILLSASFVGFCIFPYFSVLFVIRRSGNQVLAWKIFYLTGFAMFLIQILVSFLTRGSGT